MIKVVIIEDDAILLETYIKLLSSSESGLSIVGFRSFELAEKHLLKEKPAVILLDIELPGKNGIEVIPLLKRLLPKVLILMLTAYESELQLFDALKNGASGYLTKDSSSTEIIEAIFAVIEGGGPLSKNMAKMVVESFHRNIDSSLTKRELEILSMINDGKKSNEIAEELFITQETVKSHIKNIYIKLNVHTKAEAIFNAKKYKIL